MVRCGGSCTPAWRVLAISAQIVGEGPTDTDTVQNPLDSCEVSASMACSDVDEQVEENREILIGTHP